MKGSAVGGLPTGKANQQAQTQQQQQPSADAYVQSTRTEEASVRELVESCLVNEDFTPVLRIVFSGPSSSTSPGPGSNASSPGPPNGSDPGAANPRRSPPSKPAHHPRPVSALLDGRPALDVLQSVLRSIADEQDAIVQDVCSSHAMEIATCVAELDRMVASVEELRRAAAAGSEELQRSGLALASTARELHGLLSAQRHLATGVGGLRAIRRLLSRCGEVGALLAQRRLFQALQLMEQVRAKDLALALDVLSNTPQAALLLVGGDGGAAAAAGAAAALAAGAAAAAAAGGSSAVSPAAAMGGVQTTAAPAAAAAAGGGGAAARHQAAVSRLRNFLQTLVADQEAAVEYYALAEFNNWLVIVRAESRQVGLRAIRKAAIERQMEEDLAAERRAVAAALMVQRDPAAVATRVVVGAPFRRDLAREGAPPPSSSATASAAGAGAAATAAGGRLARNASQRTNAAASGSQPAAAPLDLDIATLSPGQPLQAIQTLLARHRAAAAAPLPPSCALTDYTTALLQGVDMQGLDRCVHIHRCMGRMPALRRYYLDQRRLQITTDLAPPANFLESYQSYLAQVAGFFVVEDAVRAAAPDLLSPDSAALLWEAAAASLRGVLSGALEEALAGGAPASIMLLLKDFMLLVCSALGARGFTTAPITELLTGSRLRYHDLLTASVALRVGRALATDPLADGLEVVSEQQAAELGGRLGLPASFEESADAQPVLPYRAPYTGCLPKILQAVRGFVTDSLSYLQGLLSPWELLPAVLQARDRLLAKTVVDALTDHTARLLGADAAASAPATHGSVRRGAPAHARQVMRMITNAWCLALAMQALDEWTMLQVRPLGAMAAAAAAAAAAGASSTGGAAPGTVAATGYAAVGAKPAAAGGGAAAAFGVGGFAGLGGVGPDSSTGAVLAALRSVQDGGERGLQRLLQGRVEALVGGAKSLNWLPQGPLPPGTSQYAEDLLELLKDAIDAAAAILPRSSFLFLARAVVWAAGKAFMQLLKEGVKAYNMFAVERLAADVALLDRFIAGCAVPHLAEEFAEPRQLCALLMSPRLEDVLIPEVRRQRYPSLDLGSLVVILERYREQARLGKEKTGHVSKRTVEGVCKQLRGQMVAGTAVSGLRMLEDV